MLQINRLPSLKSGGKNNEEKLKKKAITEQFA